MRKNDVTVLFDAPGPRARRRTRIVTAGVLVLVAGLVVLAIRRLDAHGELESSRWTIFAQTAYFDVLWNGLLDTLKVTAVAGLFSFPIGALLALGRTSRNRALHWVSAVWIELFRSLPLLLSIYVFLLALPRYGVNLPIFWKLLVPIVLANSAVNAEVFRAGIKALARGQSEAAAAIGLTHWQTMRLIVFPQAVRIVLPALITQLVSLLKDSTLAYVVSYNDLMRQAQNLTVFTHLLLQPYVIAAAVYIVINFLLSRIALEIDRRLTRRRYGGVGTVDHAPAASAAMA